VIASWLAIAFSGLLVAQAGGNVDGVGPPVAPKSLLSPMGPHRVEQAAPLNMKEAKDGSLSYDGSGFSARIAPDGSVTFKNKNLTGLNPIAWLPQKTRMPVPSLQSSLTRLLQGRKPPKAPPSELDEGLAPPETTTINPETSVYRPDPRENCRECSFNSLAVPVQGFGRFDATDQLERFSGQDPMRFQKRAPSCPGGCRRSPAMTG
jgi:hypothetical protein